jgi:hypothetical protein
VKFWAVLLLCREEAVEIECVCREIVVGERERERERESGRRVVV